MEICNEHLEDIRTAAKYWGWKCWARLPESEKVVWSVEDVESGVCCYAIGRYKTYMSEKASVKTWASVLARSWCTSLTTKSYDDQWWARRHGGISALVETGLDGNEGEVWRPVLVESLTPELVLIANEDKEEGETIMETSMVVRAKEVQELCDRFNVEFNEVELKNSTDRLLTLLLCDLSTDDFDKLDDKTRTKVLAWGSAWENNLISFETGVEEESAKEKSVDVKGKGSRKNKNEVKESNINTPSAYISSKNTGGGVMAKIRELFSSGVHTTPEMLQAMSQAMSEAGIPYSESTVRVTVAGLRKEAGLTSATGKGEGNRGIIAKVIELFNQGTQTLPEMLREMESTKLSYSPATIKTTVGNLRRKAGLTSGNGRIRGDRGIIKKIKELFGDGIQTVPEMIKAMELTGLDFSPSTVRMTMSKLRSGSKKIEIEKLEV